MDQLIKDNFRHCMRRLAATVCIISCQHRDERYGITASAVTSLCVDPISLLACINSASTLLPPLLAQKRYCINVLKHSQADISRRFSTPLPPHERFSLGKWRNNSDAVPYLADAQACLFCDVDRVIPYATHQIVIGRVTGCQFDDSVSPLIYQDGHYAASSPLLESLAG